jgi:hypothetical protein
LKAESNLDEFIPGGRAYSFHDMTAVRRALVLITMFAAEAESLLENLAEFYRTFMKQYFDQAVSLREAEAKIVGFTPSAQWRADLSAVRNHTRHRFGPWLAFEDKGPAVKPRWEPVLVHDWRPERLNPKTSTSLAIFRHIRIALARAADQLGVILINEINAAP